MDSLLVLVPVALLLGLLALAAFLWALRNGQYDDPDGAAGRILFDDRAVTTVPTEGRNIAQVFQFPVVYDTMTVRENLAFPLRNRRVACMRRCRRIRLAWSSARRRSR